MSTTSRIFAGQELKRRNGQLGELEERERALREQRSDLEQSHAREAKDLARKRNEAERAYRTELASWSG